jgi:hypothetical protein
MEVANALAYYYMATNTTLKIFTVLTPDLHKNVKTGAEWYKQSLRYLLRFYLKIYEPAYRGLYSAVSFDNNKVLAIIVI